MVPATAKPVETELVESLRHQFAEGCLFRGCDGNASGVCHIDMTGGSRHRLLILVVGEVGGMKKSFSPQRVKIKPWHHG